MPDLYNDIFVVGDDYEQAMFAKMFAKSRCRKAKTIEEADIVVFTGGDDVDPTLYGETLHPQTSFNVTRDKEDLEIYAECYNLGVPMLGICRGAQFGHVMNGGKLYQHVDNHYGDHPMYDVINKRQLEKVSSVHHQMVMPNEGMEVLGFCGKSRVRWLNEKEKEEKINKDIEAFFYRDTCFLGVQGHPEYSGYDEFLQWTLKTLQIYVNENTDLILNNDGVRRLKPEILAQRELQPLKEFN
jgi:gamma-glutamyl-gamma-aminobutyrate hydrolase PuuD